MAKFDSGHFKERKGNSIQILHKQESYYNAAHKLYSI